MILLRGKPSFALLGATLLCGVSAFAADDTPSNLGLHNQSEAGIVIVSGNSSSQSYNLNQANSYGWERNVAKFNLKYLDNSVNDVNTSRYWTVGVRYERELPDAFAAFAGQNIESDVFAGYRQRYNTDAGGKYSIYKTDELRWNVEAGYRFTVENRDAGQVKQNYLRFYTEATKNWTKTFSTKADVEGLPNLSQSSDYQVNTEVAANAALNDVFAIKVGYIVKYRNVPPAPATHATDMQFTTSLVAKF